MKIARAAGSYVLYAIVAYAFLFGWFACFSMRGWRGLAVGIVMPPYAWWNSVAYWFEPEPWERDWDERVQGLVRGMWVSPEEATDRQRTVLRELREWLAEVPAARRDELAQAVRSFQIVAMVDVLGIRDITDIDGVGGPEALEAHRQRVEQEPGLQRELLEETEAMHASPFMQDALAEATGRARDGYAERRLKAELYMARCRALMASWFAGTPR